MIKVIYSESFLKFKNRIQIRNLNQETYSIVAPLRETFQQPVTIPLQNQQAVFLLQVWIDQVCFAEVVAGMW